MKNFFLRFFFLFISSNILQQILSKDYKVYTYDEITENFKDLAIRCSHLVSPQFKNGMLYLDCELSSFIKSGLLIAKSLKFSVISS